MSLIQRYRMYRKIGMELNHRIMKVCLDREVMMNSARLLGLVHEDTLVFESKDETSVLMDFALNEYKENNRNLIQIYRDRGCWQNEIERDILDALLSSYTSLFKVTFISKAEDTLFLSDVLNKKENIELIDIGLSVSGVPGLLLFFRLVPLEDLNMTSGVSFVFPGNREEHLLRRYRKLSKKIRSDSDSIKRFISFFRLSKTHGLEVRYTDPPP